MLEQPTPSIIALLSKVTQEVNMIIDQAQLVDSNSSTPKADIPLVPTNPPTDPNATLLSSITELLKPINEQLEILKACEQYWLKQEGQVHINMNVLEFDYNAADDDYQEKQIMGWCHENPNKEFDTEFDLSDLQQVKA